MQLRLFRHFVPVSVVLLASFDALLITGAFYQMLSQSGETTPFIFSVTALPAQLAAGLSVAAVVTMISVGLYGEQSFVDFRLLLSKIAVAFVLVLMLAVVSAMYWRDGLPHLSNTSNLPLKATLIWLGCISVTRGTFLITLGRGLLKRRVAVLGNGNQAARIAQLVQIGENQHFVPVSFIRMPGERGIVSAGAVDWPESGPDALAELGCELGASEIVVAPDDRRGLPVKQLLHCKFAGIRVTEFLDFWERETRTVDLEALRPSWLFYSDGFRCGVFDEFLKRAFDIVVKSRLLGVFGAVALGRLLPDQTRQPRTDPLPPGASRLSRPDIYDPKIPQHADGCRTRDRAAMGVQRRCEGHPRRRRHPQTTHRRNSANTQCVTR